MYVRVVLMSVAMMNLWWSDKDVSTRPIRLIPGISCPHAPQDLRQLHAPAGGGRHDDHGQQARLQMCLHLRPVPGQPPAPIRDVHGSALWPLTWARQSFNVPLPLPSLCHQPRLHLHFHLHPTTSWPTDRPGLSCTSPMTHGVGGLCMCVCVYRFDYYLCWHSWCF